MVWYGLGMTCYGCIRWNQNDGMANGFGYVSS